MAEQRPRHAGLVILLGLMTIFGALSIDMYLPAMPGIADEFGVDTTMIQPSLSTFLVGLAIGQLGWGGVSDRLGRRAPLLIGIALFVLSSIGCALAGSVPQLLAARLLQGIGASAGQVLSRAVISDRFEGRDAARMLTGQQLVMGIGPMLAPLIGAALLVVADWRAIFWTLGALGLLVGGGAALRLPESRSAETLERARSESRLKAFGLLLSDRRNLSHVVAGGFASAAFMSWLGGSPALLQDEFGWSPQEMGALFALGGGMIIGVGQLNHLLLNVWTPERILQVALRLGVGIAALTLLAQYLAIGGRTTIVCGLLGSLAFHGLVSANNQASALARERQRAGSLSALLGASSFLVGALFTMVISLAPPSGGLIVNLAILTGYLAALTALRAPADLGQSAQ